MIHKLICLCTLDLAVQQQDLQDSTLQQHIRLHPDIAHDPTPAGGKGNSILIVTLPKGPLSTSSMV